MLVSSSHSFLSVSSTLLYTTLNSPSPTLFPSYIDKQLSFHLTLSNISITLLGDYLQREQDVTGYRISCSTAWLTICLRRVARGTAPLQQFWLLPQRTGKGQWLRSKSTNGITQSLVCLCVCVSVSGDRECEGHITHCWASGLTVNEEEAE